MLNRLYGHDQIIKKQAVKDFAEYLESKGYLTKIVYDEDENMDGEIICNQYEESIPAEEIVSEYLENN